MSALPSFGFDGAQAGATLIAMASNFVMNNQLTYRDRRLHGLQFIIGFILFALSCSIGLVANIGIARVIYSDGQIWWLAGLAGAVTGSVFNYVTSGLFVWRKR